MSTLPNPKRLEEMRAAFAQPNLPVRPLPSNKVMVSIALLGFAILCILIAWPVGFFGFQTFSVAQKLGYYGIVLVFAALFSVTAVEHMIPGAKRHLRSWALIGCSLAALVAVSPLILPEHSLNQFVKFGIPCLRLGLVSAVLSGVLGFWATRKGLFTSPFESAVLLGFFAGLTGVGVLALHCPIQNWVHMVTWHLGAMLIAGIGGALLGMRVGRAG